MKEWNKLFSVFEDANGLRVIRSMGIKVIMVGQCSKSHLGVNGVERDVVGINISINIEEIKYRIEKCINVSMVLWAKASLKRLSYLFKEVVAVVVVAAAVFDEKGAIKKN